MSLVLWGSESKGITVFCRLIWHGEVLLPPAKPTPNQKSSHCSYRYLSFLQLCMPGCTWFALAPLRAGTEVTRAWWERLYGNTPCVFWHKIETAALGDGRAQQYIPFLKGPDEITFEEWEHSLWEQSTSAGKPTKSKLLALVPHYFRRFYPPQQIAISYTVPFGCGVIEW